jgi:spermidine synthase
MNFFDTKKQTKDVGGAGKRFFLLLVLFFTGFTSLVYEIIWSRKLSLVFGANTLAVSTVLSVFMAGLALGTLYGGKLIGKAKNPYRFLSFLEVCIGLSCLASFYLIDILRNFYMVLFQLGGENLFYVNILNFILSLLILLLPTFLIGIIFPTILKLYYLEIKQLSGSVSWCYSADTLGGALGALIAGLVLIGSLGLWKTSLLASGVNIILGILIFILLGKIKPPDDQKTDQSVNQDQIKDKLVFGLFFFSGFAALVYESVWIRFFDMIYGNNLISFSLVITAFLLGLGIGSFLSKTILPKVKNKILLFSIIELLIGFSGLALLLIFPGLERSYLQIFNDANSYGVFISRLGFLAIGIMLIPTIMMGMTLPVLGAIYARGKSIAPDIGKLFASNSFGAILGSFLSGFVLFSLIGLNNTAILASLIYIGVAFIFLNRYGKAQMKTLLAVFSGTITVVLLLFDTYYQPDYLYNGAYFHGTVYEDPDGYFDLKEKVNILFTKQSPYSFVSVTAKGGGIQIKINGRSEATSNSVSQNMLGDLPLMFHPAPREVAIVGHGGGYTLNSIIQYPMVESIDDIEIDQVIIEANQYIDDNGNALSDPRVNLIIADGRNYLYTTKKKYDVIISQPSHIWASSPLFTREFLEIAKDRLNEGGIFTIWLPKFEMSDFDYAVMINTLNAVFPHLEQFHFYRNIIFLASNHKINVPDDLVLSHTENQQVATEIILIRHLTGESDLDIPEFFQQHHDTNALQSIQSKPGGIKLINTDDLPLLEFSTLRNAYQKFRQETR